jgi:hypothetical protein
VAQCCDWRKHISTGEQAVVILLGADKRQAAILRKYAEGGGAQTSGVCG